MTRSFRYQEIADSLRAAITDGLYREDGILPSESELSAVHGASRVTIRKALEALRDEGLVDSRQGFGWFVGADPLRQSLDSLETIEQQLADAGRTSERGVLKFRFRRAPDDIATLLGEEVLEVVLLNLADEQPFALVTVWCPARLGAEFSRSDLSEWANFRSSNSVSGWSGRGGQCRNPYALDRNPCGSSSGSGASVSANLASLAIGTETNGSIVCPSSASGVVGIKPTVGLVSRSRVIPISSTQDTAGPMCRTVTDAALLLGALTGVDPDDGATAASEAHMLSDYTQFLDPGGLSGARIGVSRDGNFTPPVNRVFEDAIQAMRDAGAEIIDPVSMPNANEIGGASYQVMLYEFKTGMNEYLSGLASSPVADLAGIIAYNAANPEQEMPYFGQDIMEAAQAIDLSVDDYVQIRDRTLRLAGPEGVDAVMDEHGLDAIVAPTGGPAWTIDLVNGDHFGGGSSSPAAISGYPNITVPMGMIFGLPVGLSMWGRAWSEPVLIRLASAFEAATNVRVAPQFLATADLGV